MTSVPATNSSESHAKRISRKSWVSKVLQVQSQRNPEELNAARLCIERTRLHEISARKCKAVKGLAIRNRALAAEGLKQMAEAKAPGEYAAVRDRWQSAQLVSRARQETKCKKLGKGMFSAVRRASPRRKASRNDAVDSDSSADSHASVLRAASDSEEDAMQEAACNVGASDVMVMKSFANEGLQGRLQPAVRTASPLPNPRRSAQIAESQSESDSEGEDGDSELESSAGSEIMASVRHTPAPKPKSEAGVVAALLSQLRQEPEDEAECAAKFSLYEGYASEVENMRNTLFRFHEESRPSLPSSVVTDMDRQIKHIDSEDAMRIPDRSREWFVYHMMRQAERNNLKMADILDGFDKKLKFLAENDQVECPVCLESFGNGTNSAETLGCCHKVCKECWHQWTNVMHGHAFCPLCRNEEFLGAVAARASASVPSDSDSLSDAAGSDDEF